MSSGFILPVILGDPLAEAGVNKRYGDVSPTNACCEDIVPKKASVPRDLQVAGRGPREHCALGTTISSYGVTSKIFPA